MRPSVAAASAAASSAVILPFFTCRSSILGTDFSTMPRPVAIAAGFASMATTSNPAVAAHCTMPCPMRPIPTTPIFFVAAVASVRAPRRAVVSVREASMAEAEKGGCVG